MPTKSKTAAKKVKAKVDPLKKAKKTAMAGGNGKQKKKRA